LKQILDQQNGAHVNQQGIHFNAIKTTVKY